MVGLVERCAHATRRSIGEKATARMAGLHKTMQYHQQKRAEIL
jgi:hypothetical protein